MTHSATGTLEFKAENLEHLVNILYLNAFINKDTDCAINCMGFNTDIFGNKLSLIQNSENIEKDEETIKKNLEKYGETGLPFTMMFEKNHASIFEFFFICFGMKSKKDLPDTIKARIEKYKAMPCEFNVTMAVLPDASCDKIRRYFYNVYYTGKHTSVTSKPVEEFEPSVENYVKVGLYDPSEIISPHWLRNHFDEYTEHFGNNFFQYFLQENKEWILDFLDAHPHKGSIYTSLYDLARDSDDSELYDLLWAKNAIFL